MDDGVLRTCVGFLLLARGLRPAMVGLAGTEVDAVFFITVLLVTFELVAAPVALYEKFDFFGSTIVLFVEGGFFTLFIGSAVSSALTSWATSSINLAASSWLIVDADNSNATKTKNLFI